VCRVNVRTVEAAFAQRLRKSAVYAEIAQPFRLRRRVFDWTKK